MSPPVKVRFKIAWGQNRAGDIITPAALFRGELLQRGIVELVKDDPMIEAAAIEPAETASLPQPSRKRGGRRT